MYNYSLNHIKYLRRRALRLPFRLPEGFEGAPFRALQRAYNGIGPDRWSPYFRKLMTWILEFLEAPALIHDFEFQTGGSYWKFTAANVRLFFNTVIEAIDRRSWKIFFSGIAAGILCQLFGYRGWKKEGEKCSKTR